VHIKTYLIAIFSKNKVKSKQHTTLNTNGFEIAKPITIENLKKIQHSENYQPTENKSKSPNEKNISENVLLTPTHLDTNNKKDGSNSPKLENGVKNPSPRENGVKNSSPRENGVKKSASRYKLSMEDVKVTAPVLIAQPVGNTGSKNYGTNGQLRFPLNKNSAPQPPFMSWEEDGALRPPKSKFFSEKSPRRKVNK